MKELFKILTLENFNTRQRRKTYSKKIHIWFKYQILRLA